MLRALAAKKLLDKDFAQFEQNRMYPRGYRKESAMQTLKMEHVDAISHAEVYIHPAIVPNMPPHQRQEIENDLARLAEIKRYILRLIYAPGFFDPLAIPKDPKHDGHEA